MTGCVSAAYSPPLHILAPYVPTPLDVVARLLELAQVTAGDVVHDLGCGDGRVVIEAARQHQASGVGVDTERYWIEQATQNAAAAGVSHLVLFQLQDALTADLSSATVIVLYLLHWSTQRLAPLIAARARAGTRVVSHGFPIDSWVPEKVESFTDSSGTPRTLYLWRLPAVTAPQLPTGKTQADDLGSGITTLRA